MPVSPLPTSKEIEHPLLALLFDEKEHRWRDLYYKLADHYSLTDKELDERLPSGQRRFYNRCARARLNLKLEGFVESPRREYWKITKHWINKLP